MPTTCKTLPTSANPTEPAPVVPGKKRRVLTPSVVTPHLAAVAPDLDVGAPGRASLYRPTSRGSIRATAEVGS